MPLGTVNFYLAPNLPPARHAFFGRCGGASTDKYDSFNFNYRSKDKPENIERNLELVGKFYGLTGAAVMRPRQAHTATSVYVDRPSRYEIDADGVVTDKPDIILGITTADCMPVLLADDRHGVVGAAHAGWRGALAGVVENTIALMMKKGARREDIAAAAGPCLQKQSFEVRRDMLSLFLAQDEANAEFFTPFAADGWLFDLESYMRRRLNLAGIENVSFSGIDTFTEEELYFSYRRACRQGLVTEPADFPVELSTIKL